MKAILISIIMVFVFYSSGFAQTLEERIKILEEALKKQEQTIKEQQKVIEELKTEMKQGKPSEQQAVTPPKEAAPPLTAQETEKKSTLEQVQQQVQQLKEEVGQVVEAQKKNILSVFNPAIGLVGESILSYRSRGSNETGSDRPGGFDFNQRSVELNLAGSVDPFARGYAVINASADPVTGEATAQVEEAAIQTTSLPWNLTLKAGIFFGEFGRLSYIHDHELPFVNRPLVLDNYIGGESKTDGVQLNFLLPIPHYVSLTVGVGDQFGDTPNAVGNFRHFDELNFWGRASTYFDLTPDVSLETGVSGLWTPSEEDRGGVFVQPDGSILTERRRLVVGADLMVRYQPLRNNQFQSLTWGTELLYSDNRYLDNPTGIPGGPVFNRDVGSFGLYSYLAYKLHRQWIVGCLFDWMENPQNNADKTSAYSAWITWAISHWNQLRLQYTYTTHNALSGLKNDNAIYLQWAWIIGSHAHGWQER
ncbi:MAG TPA: hypothetical protein VEK32_00905 [Thermodesulfobacteriota bacterium]|nr:hypothetical protein [Thermodesulfobacteriota bacterium]